MSNKKPSLRSLDPYLERERGQYDEPLPSREYILQLLAQEGVPVTVEHLETLLSIKSKEREVFTRRLRAMERDGQLMRNRKNALCLPAKLDLIPAKVQGHPDGFGFAIPDDRSGDVFLSTREMKRVLDGDRVMVRVTGRDPRGRPEGSIVEVLSHANTQVVGRLFEEHGIWFVVAENRRISQDILVPPDNRAGAKPGQVVMAELVAQPGRHSEPVARVVEVLGNYADPGMEVEIALRKHDLPHEFSKQALAQAQAFEPQVKKADLKGREDLRSLPFVTIDGETAKDFDDAVFAEPHPQGFRLWVAIADVSAYVKPGDALDHDAQERGNSVYFPRRVIPMLPEELSNGLCSLNPQVDRLCLACHMIVSPEGEVLEYRFADVVIYSHARLTYTQVAEALEQGRVAKGPLATLLPQLKHLQAVFLALLKAREKRGAIDFSSNETLLQFDAEEKIQAILPVERNQAHRIIEECMLVANLSAAHYLASHQHVCLYRVHPEPAAERVEAVREFLGEFGLSLQGGDQPRAQDYSRLVAKIAGRPDQHLLETVLLRSLQQATYSPDNQGHFGLAYDAYTHFTSPIRRYPDLLVHRSIRAVMAGKTYNPGSWKELGEHCSATERRADEASRDVENWLKCYFMKDRVGEVFTGSVSSVTSFGLFVALDEIFVEGLIHISELGTDYFQFDATRHQLLGERTGKRYRLGDRIQVQLVRVDMESSKIDFLPVREDDDRSSRKGKGKRGKR